MTEGRFFCHDSAPEDLYSRVWGNHNHLDLSTHPQQKIITQMAVSIQYGSLYKIDSMSETIIN